MYFDQKEFGSRIQQLRKQRGFTQDELAQRLGVGKVHIYKMEKGIKACSIDLLVEMAEFFHVSTDYLLTGKDFDLSTVREKLMCAIGDLSAIAELL